MSTSSSVRYLSFDYLTNKFTGEIMGLTGVTWSEIINATGSFSGTLNLRDENVSASVAGGVINPGKTVLLAVTGTEVLWGGLITGAEFTASTGVMTISGADFLTILDRMQQQFSYSGLPNIPGANLNFAGSPDTWASYAYEDSYAFFWPALGGPRYWVANPVAPAIAAFAMIGDALSYNAYQFVHAMPGLDLPTTGGLINVTPVIHSLGGSPPPAYWMAIDHPLSQRLSLGAACQKLAGAKVYSGFDISFTATLVDHVPEYALEIWWPRMGVDVTVTPTEVPVVYVNGSEGIDFTYTIDATQQYTTIFVTSGSASKGLKAGASDYWSGTTFAGNGYYTADPILVDTWVNVSQWDDDTIYPGKVVACVPVGEFGWSTSIAWTGATPPWATETLAGFTMIVQDGPTSQGYPPSQMTASYSTTNSLNALDALAYGDLAASQWPISNPVLTIDLDNALATQIKLGDDIRVVTARNEIWPSSGLDCIFRVVQKDTVITDVGVSTVAFTLTMPFNTDGLNGFPGVQPPSI